MATYGTDLNTVTLCDTNTGWSELSGHTSGSADSQDTENYIHNGASVSQPTGQATGTNAGMEYDYGSNITWTAGYVILAWQYYSSPTNLYDWATGGMRLGVGSSSGNMNFWKTRGDDFGGAPYNCWQNVAVDPSDPSGTTYSNLTADYTDGSPTTGNYRIIGSLPNVRAKISKGNPHAVDAIRYGRAEIYATGTGGTFTGYASANDASTARWGLFQVVQGGYLWKGLFSFGQSGTSLTFSDTNKNIFVDDTPRVRDTFNKMQTLNASTSVTWTNINITGVGTSITGSAAVSPGDFDFSVGTIDINGGAYTDLGIWTFNSNSTIDDATFRRCESIASNSAQFTNTQFDSANDTEAVVVANLNELDGCHFIIDSTNGGHGVELTGAAGSYTWNCTASGYDSGTAGEDVEVTGASITGDETIHVTATTGTIIINVSTGATVPSVSSAGASVDVVSSFDHTITGLELNTEVTYVTAGTSTELFHVEDATTSDGDGKYKTVYSHAGGGTVDILIHHKDYVPDVNNQYNITLPSSDASIKVNMSSDINYENP